MRRACNALVFEDIAGLPEADPGWGEPGLSKAEKIMAWTSVVMLAALTGHPDAPTNAVQGEARATLQVRHTVDVPAAEVIPALRRHLDARGFSMVAIDRGPDREPFPASRTDPDEKWVKLVAGSIERTAGRAPNVCPNSSGGNPSELFKEVLGTPVIWVPNSYAGCGQHGPDEHALGSLLREGLGLMAGIWWISGSGSAGLDAYSGCQSHPSAVGNAAARLGRSVRGGQARNPVAAPGVVAIRTETRPCAMKGVMPSGEARLKDLLDETRLASSVPSC